VQNAGIAAERRDPGCFPSIRPNAWGAIGWFRCWRSPL